ncbi:MAG: Xenobiotic-transporting ATPase [Parcubacteria group bacterium GW2011_GWA2_47_7]|nr:MAG: Xenobiotic-transporting ATPase [Parcubacteria group bacterium GW2011_GWA2_47_7]
MRRDFSNKNLEEIPSKWFDRFMRKVLGAKDVIFFAQKEQNIQARDVLRLFYESLRKFPLSIIAVISATIFSSILLIIIPLYYKNFFDVLSSGGDATGNAILLRNTILVIFGLNITIFVTRRITSFGNNYLASSMTASLRSRAFAYLIDHSQRFFTGTFTGTLVQRVNRFANAYDRLADRIIFDIIPIIIQVIGVAWILFRERPIMALIVLVWAFIFISSNYAFGHWKLKYDIASAAQDSKTAGVLADIITNQPTVDAHGSHAIEKSRYQNEVNIQMRMSRFRWNLGESMESIQGFFVVLVEFAVFYVGVGLWVKGEFSIGLFVLVQAYIIRLSNQLWSFSRIIRDIYETFADAKEMAEIMLAPHEIIETDEAEKIEHVEGVIQFDHVSFGYQKEETVIDFATTIKSGERVALVGPSGAGKSTIVKLLFRFYDSTEGDILIDGVSVRKLSIRSRTRSLP